MGRSLKTSLSTSTGRKRDAYARELVLRIKVALKLGRPAVDALKTTKPIDQWTPKTVAVKNIGKI